VSEVNRRSLLVKAAAAGGALTLGFDIPFGAASPAEDRAPEITAWVVIAPDDSVTIRVARSEMGQGSLTALPMLVAEELGCDWSKVKAEFASPEENLRRNRVWGDMSTGGSRSIRASQDYLRKAGATAREMLIAAAAAQWGVPPAECRAENNVITHGPSGRTVRLSGKANKVGYYYRPADDFIADEPGIYTVDLSVTFDGITSAGQVTQPFPRGDVLGTTNGRFYVYVVPRGGPALNVGLADQAQVNLPALAVNATAPAGVSLTSGHMTVRPDETSARSSGSDVTPSLPPSPYSARSVMLGR